MTDAGGTRAGPEPANLHVVRRDAGSGAQRDTVAGRGRRVVLLHGITDAGACWAAVAARLDASYEVVMPDARGHGLSPLPDEVVTIERLADDVAASLPSPSEPSVVIGHSMGAATALALAARHPDLVDAVVLEDPPWLDEPTDGDVVHADGPAAGAGADAPDFASWIRELQELDHDGRVEAGRADAPIWSEDELQSWAVAKEQVDVRFFDRLDHASMRRSHRYLAELTVPILLVTGDPARGAFVTSEAAEAAQARTPHLEVLHVEGASHSIHRDRPDVYLDAVQAFLDRTLA